MKYGVSYYPEHKDADERKHDMRLLKESGINTVRMGEFAWCRMEPEEGRYDFGWLKEAVRELGEAGIQTIICTPTACPPAWLAEKHPDIMYMDNRRIRRPFGGRRDYCYNNETYRGYSVRIASELARAFANDPYVSGVQIDNEPAQEGTGRCCCPVCEEKFHSWLEKKYNTIQEFNRRSGSIFWSQEYDDFRQIPIPVNTIEVGASQQIGAFYENPTVRLDFERFCSESQRDYQNLQAEAIRKYLKVPVTTNATGLATNSIDYYDSTRELDCYAFDYYPGLRDAQVDSFPYAFARGVKPGVPFWVLEFMSGGGHRLSGSGRVQPNPGALKQAVIHSMAHGGEMMLHFQFRTYPFGAEQLNYAIVDMDGVPRRRYREMQDTARLLKQLEPVEQYAFARDAAVCFDYDSHWALRIKPVNDPVYHYIDDCGRWYHQLERLGVNADVTSLDADWSSYKLIILPSLFVLSQAHQEKIREYVKQGGTVAATFLTSVKNKDNVGYTDVLPAGLTEVFGTTVEEVEPVFEHNHTMVRLTAAGRTVESQDFFWSELLGGASGAVAEYREDYKKGCKAVSCQSYGAGRAYYVGTGLNEEAMGALLQEAVTEAGVRQTLVDREEKVELVTRYGEKENILYLFNFTAHETTVTLPEGLRDYLTGEALGTECVIARNGILVAAARRREQI